MWRSLTLTLVLAATPCAWPTAARGEWRQTPQAPIATDRPGNGNAATTVTQGHLNVEAGALYATSPGTRSHQLSLPAMLRLGVWRRLELRAGTGVLGYARDASGNDVNPTDTSAGLKVAVLHAHGPRPDLAISTDVFFPTGDAPFTAGTTLPEVRALAAWSLPRDLGLLLNAGADVPEDGQGTRYLRALWVANLGYAPHRLKARLSFFVEGFGRHAMGAGSEQIVQIDWGMSSLLSDDLQLDFFFQHGLTEDAPDLQVSLGCSARL